MFDLLMICGSAEHNAGEDWGEGSMLELAYKPCGSLAVGRSS